MKKILGIVVMGLLWCHTVLADDIRDFQIAGMSIGVNDLDYFSENELKDFPKSYYPNKKYYLVDTYSSKYETYSNVQFAFKTIIIKFTVYPERLILEEKILKSV